MEAVADAGRQMTTRLLCGCFWSWWWWCDAGNEGDSECSISWMEGVSGDGQRGKVSEPSHGGAITDRSGWLR